MITMEDWEIKYLKRYQSTKTAVFWDLQDCGIPDGLNVVQVSKNIKSALKEMNYSGPASIYAYGDTDVIRDNIQSTGILNDHRTEIESEIPVIDRMILEYRRTLSIYADETQIEFNHADSKDARLEMILVDMFSWAMKNQSPANILLIFGENSEYIMEFIMAFHRLKSAGHNLLLAQPTNASRHPGLPLNRTFVWENLSVGDILCVEKDRSQPPPPRPEVGSKVGGLLVAGAGALCWIGCFLLRRGSQRLRSH